MITYEFKKGSASYVDIASEPYGVRVEKSEGIIGRPNLKDVNVFDWQYINGGVPDLRNRRYESRTVKLTCWMSALSKQQLYDNFNSFMAFFAYDDIMLMKISWNNRDDAPTVVPDIHSCKGIYGLVYLKSVDNVDYKYRYGRQTVKFTLTFIDPYPVKRVLSYTGSEAEGVDYAITSETEIDIFTSDGLSVRDILSGSGHIAVTPNNVILVCGDVSHATTSHSSGNLIDPTSNLDSVTVIYSEI